MVDRIGTGLAPLGDGEHSGMLKGGRYEAGDLGFDDWVAQKWREYARYDLPWVDWSSTLVKQPWHHRAWFGSWYCLKTWWVKNVLRKPAVTFFREGYWRLFP